MNNNQNRLMCIIVTNFYLLSLTINRYMILELKTRPQVSGKENVFMGVTVDGD